jgi:predicted dehydrogenase
MIRIAVAGFGFMGRTHTRNILMNPDLELVALVSRNPDNIRKSLNENSGNFSTGLVDEDFLSDVNLYSSLADCLKKETLDACVISVHTDLHFELTRLALNAGVNVFLEKPFCLETAHCRELINLADRAKLILMIGHVVRFMPAYKILKDWIDGEEFGLLKFLSLSRYSGVPAWGQWKEKQLDYGSSGGAIFDLVIHDIDYAQWVLGNPDKITASYLPGQLSRHDYVNANWRYHTGTVVRIEGGNIFHSTFPFQAGYMAWFENASVLFSTGYPENIIVATDEDTRLIASGDPNEGFYGELAYFAECIKNQRSPLNCSPESALNTIELCYQHL